MKRMLLPLLLVLCLLALAVPAAAAEGTAALPPYPGGGDDGIATVDIAPLLIQEGGAPLAVADTTPDPELSAAVRAAILQGLHDRAQEISLTQLGGVPIEMLSQCYHTVLNDNPDLFYVDNGFSYGYSGSYATLVFPTYRAEYSPADVDRFHAACASVVAQMPEGRTEYKYLWLHDWLITHCTYDMTKTRHNAYHALVEGDAVCQGYALAYIALCREAGLEASYISSSDLDHGWNLVKMNGKNYYVDCTWDDPTGCWEGYCKHTNFLRSRDGMVGTEHDSTDWLTVYGEDAYNGVSTSADYDSGAWWAEQYTAIANVGSTFAYAPGSDSSSVYLRSAVTGAVQTVAHGKTATWYVWNSSTQYYTSSYMTVAAEGGSFWFNTPKEIWRMTPGGTVSSFYTLSSSEQATGYIYQLEAGPGCLYYGLGTAPSIRTLPLSSVSTGNPAGLVLEVSDENGLNAALNSVVPVAEIHITDDFTLERNCSILYSPGYLENYANTLLVVDEGVTLTVGEGGVFSSAWYTYEGDGSAGPQPNGRIIVNGSVVVADGGAVEGELYRVNGSVTVQNGGACVVCTENYGSVTVQSGGEYRTTQGCEAYNRGTTVICDGGLLETRFGSTLHNLGSLTVDGVFICNCIGADAAVMDVMWFDNVGSVDGCGRIFLCEADPDSMPVHDLDALCSAMISQIGDTPPYCYALTDVSDAQSLADDLEDSYTSAVRLTGDATVTGEVSSLGLVLVPEGVTLTVADGAWLNAQLLILPGGAVNVASGGILATTQAGDRCILNHGTLTVAAGGELRTIFGGEVWNAADGTLSVYGLFSCAGYKDDQGGVHIWFDNRGCVTGTGTVRAELIFNSTDGADAAAAAQQLASALDCGDLFLQVRADSGAAVAALNAAASVDSILLSGEPDARIGIGADLSLVKELCADDGISFVVTAGKTLTVAAPILADTLELQGSLVIVSGGSVSADTVLYGNACSVSCGTVAAQEAEKYECLIDLYEGDPSGKLQLFQFANRAVWLESLTVPAEPYMDGRVFEGWEFGSGWSGVTPEQLAAIAVEEENGEHYVFMPDFPITMTARWSSAAPLSIDADLADYVGPLGSTASFTVQASGEGLTYQWWVKSRTASKFSKSSVTRATYSVTLTEARNGNQIYCVVTDAYGNTLQTNTATMAVAQALVITAELADYVGPAGSTAVFTVEATGEGLTYQWYVKSRTATKFSKSSVTSATYSVTLTEANSGRQLYCIVTDAFGNTAQTNVVTMTAAEALTVAELTDYAGPEGSTAAFTVEATGEGLTYQWWVKKPTASKFSKSSITAPTYSVTLTEARNGNQVYCMVFDTYGHSAVTNTATMTIAEGLSVADLTDFSGPAGSTAVFTVEATGEGLTYQWYVKKPTATKFSKSSITGPVYEVELTEARNGNQVYCVVTDAFGNTARTNTVTMTIAEALAVADLTDYVGPLGSTASFTAEAAGEGLTYQWYVKKPTATKFSKSSITGPVYEVELTEARNGNQIYCVVTDAYGETVRTNTVSMTIG